ncbi:MAG: radical SAM protein [Lachnospiraceae bacterium]|nr:radical SAM protein [Lachnospiraceae bacterium]
MPHALFEKIYVEERTLDDPETRRILERTGCTDPEVITHYKDVFDKKNGSGGISRSLILARNPGRHLYEGAPVCQSFGNEHFYYSPGVMNCIYDCEYCFLKGMYPGKDICIFTDIGETFSELDELEKSFPVYVCASYNTDLTALEDLTGYVERWCERALEHERFSVEIRSKCSRTDIYQRLPVSDRAIFAFTLSPDEITGRFEKGTPGLDGRLRAIAAAMEAGFPVRICFDPMIYVRNWRELYSNMIAVVAGKIDLSLVKDISIGTFRISEQYLKNMRRKMPDSEIAQYPYISEAGYYQYSEKVRTAMEDHILAEIMNACSEARVFNWR